MSESTEWCFKKCQQNGRFFRSTEYSLITFFDRLMQIYQRKIDLPFAECTYVALKAESNEFATNRIFALVNKNFMIGAPTTCIIDTTFNRFCRRGCNNRVSKNVYCLQLDSFLRTGRWTPCHTETYPNLGIPNRKALSYL